ncbi:hypothetical protein K435DRAFT_448836 [Dendrothele bispora CBS 962.96]|uniref:Uncharacterized protein n=1 Tax=Dendrothele bispora (strain CBS 962.96) TaxID=1314807 RepID=A0A4S8L2G7_DENBC|nr:hypothetical protein K435DRAFT_448836 [Dendrothele bispora CBS 962.96]
MQPKTRISHSTTYTYIYFSLSEPQRVKSPPHSPISEQNLRPNSVIHFDTHPDTWPPMGTTAQESINHGSFFTVAAEEGFLTDMSVHAGIR